MDGSAFEYKAEGKDDTPKHNIMQVTSVGINVKDMSSQQQPHRSPDLHRRSL